MTSNAEQRSHITINKLRSVWHLIDVSLFAQVAREGSDVTYFHHGLKADVLLNAHLEVIQRRRM